MGHEPDPHELDTTSSKVLKTLGCAGLSIDPYPDNAAKQILTNLLSFRHWVFLR
ncbi:MAG: hypothetical protein OSB11_11395 [Gammaproteobacteria bacterium]|nr:hypothetical protein [Gammaproteobacteria bacterium]